MRICFFAHADSIHTRRWTRYFRDRGHQVSVVTLTPAEPDPGIELHHLQHRWHVSYERTNWHYLLKLPRLWKVVRNIQPDILNAHFLSSYGILGALVRPVNCPLIVSLHGSDILTIPNRSFLHSWAARFALSRVDMVTSVAHHMTQVLSNYMPPGKPILTLQYGVDTELFCPPASSVPRSPICLSNRAMVPVCNLETILLAARKLADQGSPVRIHLAGDGQQSAFLRQKATELQLGDQVSFLGLIDHDRMPKTLQLASIYVSTSLSDGTSLSLLEAMACGAFPVVSNIPANCEWITDGVNGYLVSPDSPEQLAQKLSDAWSQPKLRQAAAEYNWSLIQDKGSYQKNMAVIESAFKRLVEQRA